MIIEAIYEQPAVTSSPFVGARLSAAAGKSQVHITLNSVKNKEVIRDFHNNLTLKEYLRS